MALSLAKLSIKILEQKNTNYSISDEKSPDNYQFTMHTIFLSGWHCCVSRVNKIWS